MRRAQTSILRSILHRSLQADGTTAAAACATHSLSSMNSSIQSLELSNRQFSHAARAAEQKACGMHGIAALAGSTAAFWYMQPQAHALVAEPQPGADAVAQELVQHASSSPDVYALPRKGLRGVPKEVILYQYDVCPFCCKVKAVLDYYQIPYRCVEVGPLLKAELKWSEKYKKVPVIMLDDEVLVDSSAIISRIAAEKDAEAAKQSPAQQPQKRGWFGGRRQAEAAAASSPAASHTEEETRWRRWVDERLVRVLTINIYRNRAEAFQTFDYITQQGNFNWVEREFGRVIGAAIMWTVSGRLKKKYGIEGEPRAELYASAQQWMDAIGDRQFLGGDEPNLADLSVFGAVRSITGTDTFMDLMHQTQISSWYERMIKAVGESARLA